MGKIDRVIELLEMIEMNLAKRSKSNLKVSKKRAIAGRKGGLAKAGKTKIANVAIARVPTISANVLENLSLTAKNRLTALYPEHDFVEREVLKMQIWLDANRHKVPKSRSGWARFVLGWLERGWESHRKGLASNAVEKPKKSILELLKEDEGNDAGSI